jgi:hypothetical protein
VADFFTGKINSDNTGNPVTEAMLPVFIAAIVPSLFPVGALVENTRGIG